MNRLNEGRAEIKGTPRSIAPTVAAKRAFWFRSGFATSSRIAAAGALYRSTSNGAPTPIIRS